jgi:hypothetical protein
MTDGKEKTQRRVYVLPAELVDRIVAFQNETGLTSEVEAARRLLDDALKSRDTYKTILTRFLSRLAQTRIPSEIAKEVLVGHPLIQRIKFIDDGIEFGMKGGFEITISKDGKYVVLDENENLVEQSSSRKPLKKRDDFDDEIPF